MANKKVKDFETIKKEFIEKGKKQGDYGHYIAVL